MEAAKRAASRKILSEYNWSQPFRIVMEATLFDQGEKLHRHKENEKRVSARLDSHILEYLQRAIDAVPPGEWSRWFRPEHRPGEHSMTSWIYERFNTSAAPDSCRRRMMALCKRMGYEVENLNSTGKYRVKP